MEWAEINKNINRIILDNNNIEDLVEEIVDFLDAVNIDQDDKERAENMLYAKMDDTNSYKRFVGLIKPRLRKTLDVAHFTWQTDDDEPDDYGLDDDQIEGGVY